jgi:hypothetical protein
MPDIVKFVGLAELLFQPANTKKSVVANREVEPLGPSLICEPEPKFWKLSAVTTAPKSGFIEIFVLVLFLLLGAVAIITCFAELFHLLGSDAIGHVAAKAINGD